MKKVLIAAAMLAMASVNVFAYSFFVGGALSASGGTLGGSAQDPDTGILREGISSFGISPYVGYLLNDKSDISIGITYSNSTYNEVIDANTQNALTYEQSETEIGVSVAYEYLIAAYGPLSVYISPAVSYSQISYKEGDSAGKIGLSITPNVQYALSDRIGLIAGLNFLSLDWSSTEGITEFSFGVDTNDIASSALFTIGFFVNF
jgi:hypothetical protein